MKNTSYVILYDGTFYDLINIIEYLLKEKIKPINIKSQEEYIPNLFDITFNPKNNSNKLFNYLFSYKNIFKNIYYAFLTKFENKEMQIFYFIINFLKYKEKVVYYKNLNCVINVLKMTKYVSNENHKFKGFTRFRMVNNNFLVAIINPENNILELLSQHFSRRLKNELWIIYDENHQLISIYNKTNYIIYKGIIENLLFIEEDWEKLWKSFYNKIAIEERKNLKCQINHMPKKYWKYIIEMEGNENEKSN